MNTKYHICIHKHYFSIQNIHPQFIPKNSGNRANEIQSMDWEEGANGEQALHLVVRRKSLHDTLPEALFHPLQPIDLQTVKETDYPPKQREQAARQFFSGLDAEFYRAEWQLEGIECGLLSALYGDRLYEQLCLFWELEGYDYLTKQQKEILLELLPITHRIVGNWELMGFCFAAILGCRVHIHSIAPKTIEREESIAPTFGSFCLGRNAIVGDSFNDGIPTVQIQICPKTQAKAMDYLPNGRGLQIVEEVLCPYFMPISHEYSICIDPEEKGFQVAVQKEESGILGFTSIL